MDNGSLLLESEITMDLMKIYGFNKVRGGGYSLGTYPEDYPTPALDSHINKHIHEPLTEDR